MKKILLLSSVVLAFYACQKTSTTPSSTSTDGGAPGTITGKVTQYDQYSAQYTVGLNAVTVSIDGTTYSTITDVNGGYTLTNVAPGTYNVSFNKTGCGLWQQQQVSFVGNGIYYLNGYSVQKPTYTFINANVKDSVIFGSNRIYVNVSLSPLSEASGILIISGNNASLDITNPSSYSYINIDGIPANTSSLSLYYGPGISGTTYYKLYPYPNVAAGYSYYNYPSGNYIYSAYGTPVPTTFTITLP